MKSVTGCVPNHRLLNARRCPLSDFSLAFRPVATCAATSGNPGSRSGCGRAAKTSTRSSLRPPGHTSLRLDPTIAELQPDLLQLVEKRRTVRTWKPERPRMALHLRGEGRGGEELEVLPQSRHLCIARMEARTLEYRGHGPQVGQHEAQHVRRLPERLLTQLAGQYIAATVERERIRGTEYVVPRLDPVRGAGKLFSSSPSKHLGLHVDVIFGCAERSRVREVGRSSCAVGGEESGELEIVGGQIDIDRRTGLPRPVGRYRAGISPPTVRPDASSPCASARLRPFP